MGTSELYRSGITGPGTSAYTEIGVGFCWTWLPGFGFGRGIGFLLAEKMGSSLGCQTPFPCPALTRRFHWTNVNGLGGEKLNNLKFDCALNSVNDSPLSKHVENPFGMNQFSLREKDAESSDNNCFMGKRTSHPGAIRAPRAHPGHMRPSHCHAASQFSKPLSSWVVIVQAQLDNLSSSCKSITQLTEITRPTEN